MKLKALVPALPVKLVTPTPPPAARGKPRRDCSGNLGKYLHPPKKRR